MHGSGEGLDDPIMAGVSSITVSWGLKLHYTSVSRGVIQRENEAWQSATSSLQLCAQ